MAYLPLLSVSQISAGFSRSSSSSSLFLYLSCLLPRQYSNGKGSTSSTPATLHHHSPSTRLHHVKSICSPPPPHRPHRRRTTTTPRVHHPIVKSLWTACGRACGKQRSKRWRLSLPRSSPSNVAVGRQHHHRCQPGHLSPTNRTSSQRSYKKENLSKLSPSSCTPILFPPAPLPLPSHVSRISRNHPPRSLGP